MSLHTFKHSILVFYGCLTDYHKLSGFKQYPFSSSQFCRSEICLCSGYRKVKIKVLSGGSGEIFAFLLVSVVGGIQFLLIVGPMSSSLRWLSAGNHSWFLELHTFLAIWPLHLQVESTESNPSCAWVSEFSNGPR